mmetsp:Transcript_95521/g.252333  ORF Transcript_95521/g.252333 Transcript_95521/m.252333 type:complete len:210 (+) Transcript_95521:427-1056(+)
MVRQEKGLVLRAGAEGLRGGVAALRLRRRARQVAGRLVGGEEGVVLRPREAWLRGRPGHRARRARRAPGGGGRGRHDHSCDRLRLRWGPALQERGPAAAAGVRLRVREGRAAGHLQAARALRGRSAVRRPGRSRHVPALGRVGEGAVPRGLRCVRRGGHRLRLRKRGVGCRARARWEPPPRMPWCAVPKTPAGRDCRLVGMYGHGADGP